MKSHGHQKEFNPNDLIAHRNNGGQTKICFENILKGKISISKYIFGYHHLVNIKNGHVKSLETNKAKLYKIELTDEEKTMLALQGYNF